MIDPPKIIQTQCQQAAVIFLKVPRSHMQNVFGPAVEELRAEILEQQSRPVGPVFAHHFRIRPEAFEFEVGIPVSSRISYRGRVCPGELPAATAARTVYYGRYEGLPGAWQEFMDWIEQQGLRYRDDLWECYLSGPWSSLEPMTWRTELVRPLVSDGDEAGPKLQS